MVGCRQAGARQCAGERGQVGTDIVQAFLHPIDTYENLRDLGHDVMQKLGVMSGTAPMEEAVNEARGAVEQLRRERGDL